MERRYGNREIVAEYLQHKLAQRGYEWSADEWRSHEAAGGNGAPPGLPDGAATPTDAAEPSEAVGQDTRPPAAPLAANMTDPMLRDAPPDVHCTLRWATDEFSRRYCRDYGHLSEQLLCPSPPGTAHTRFTMVVEELFSNGINWGRIVAFFEFGGALCIESVHREMAPQLVDSIATWMTEYLDQHLQRWILDNGGWLRYGLIPHNVNLLARNRIPYDPRFCRYCGLAIDDVVHLSYKCNFTKDPSTRWFAKYTFDDGIDILKILQENVFVDLDAFVALYGNRGAPVVSFSWFSTKMFLGLAVLGVCITLGAYLGHK